MGGALTIVFDRALPCRSLSSPGYAILDSGCGKTIIGRQTLEAFQEIWREAGIDVKPEVLEKNVFRYGNGHQEVSNSVIEMPVFLAGRPGRIRAAIVRGQAPLLLSRPALKTLQARVNFVDDTVLLFPEQVAVPMEVNSAGQYAVRVVGFPPQAPALFKPSGEAASEAKPEPVSCLSVSYNHKRQKVKDFWEFRPSERIVIRHHRKPRSQLFTPAHTQCPIVSMFLQDCRLTKFDRMTPTCRDLSDDWTDAHQAHAKVGDQPWTGQTIFRLSSNAPVPSLPAAEDEFLRLMSFTSKQHRCLMAQLKPSSNREDRDTGGYDIVELFSPPRFALEGAKLGYRVLSADLCTGWDFRKSDHRNQLKDIVRRDKPKLLVCCPPCTWAGGWWHLNRLRMSEAEVAQKESWARLFISFCCEVMAIQKSHGGRFLFEHPRDSVAWRLRSMEQLCKDGHQIPVDMCCYGLSVPGGPLVRKPTSLLVSHADMKSLSRKCPGDASPQHRQHQSISGSWPKLGCISKHAAKYTTAFVKAVLRLTRDLPATECLKLSSELSVECLVAHTVEEMNQEPDNKITDSIRRLHNNLGHPTNQQLVRVLKHGGASEAALTAARSFSCDHCKALKSPTVAHPAQTHRVVEFNALVGVDVKYLRGWLTNQKIPALNILDHASSMQIVVPIFQRETAKIILKTFMERWVSWAGVPQEIVLDPARANVADAFTTVLEQGGATFKLTAADAHWQLGKTEVHGGWFSKILDKILMEHSPTTQEEWIECVNSAHCKNQLIQVYGMTPSQFVFGKNPRVPENLLDEPLEVVPATASLYEEKLQSDKQPGELCWSSKTARHFV